MGKIQFDTIESNEFLEFEDGEREIDIVLINGDSVALIEVKYKVHPNDLDQIQKQIIFYRKARPQHAHYKIYGGIAGLSVPDDVITAAKKRGFFVLKQKGEVIEYDTEGMKAYWLLQP